MSYSKELALMVTEQTSLARVRDALEPRDVSALPALPALPAHRQTPSPSLHD